MKHSDRIILFATGALFSQTVLDSLLGKDIRPVAIVLPVYPPATIENLPGVKIEADSNSSEFIGQALELSIPLIYAPENSQHSLPVKISAIQGDYILVACWPYLLSEYVIRLAGKAALNIHPSLLPKYPGANPISDQLADAEVELGVTLHLLNEEFDRGDILSQVKLTFPFGYPNKEEYEVRSAEAGAGLFIDAMKEYQRPVRQPEVKF